VKEYTEYELADKATTKSFYLFFKAEQREAREVRGWDSSYDDSFNSNTCLH